MTVAKRSAKNKKPELAPMLQCPHCHDELSVHWQGRAWCITCDADLLFGDPDARDEQVDRAGGGA